MSSAPVRARLVWSGLLVTVIGMLVLAGADLTSSRPEAAAGTLLFLGGVAVAVRGGALRDFRAQTSFKTELADAITGRARPPGRADAVVADPSARADARATETEHAHVLRRRSAAPRPRLDGRVGGPTLLGVTLAMVLAQGLFPISVTGQDHGLRALGLSVLAGLCGLRIGWVDGHHPVAAAVAMLTGFGLLASAVLGDHDSSAVPWFTGTCGALVLIAAALGRTTDRG